MPLLQDGRFRYRGLRLISSDARPAFKRARPRPKPLKPPRPKRPKRAEPKPLLANPPRAERWLYIDGLCASGAGAWFADLGEALAAMRPEQMSERSRPVLAWKRKAKSARVWIGKLTWTIPGREPRVWTIGCLKDRAQDFQHALLD